MKKLNIYTLFIMFFFIPEVINCQNQDSIILGVLMNTEFSYFGVDFRNFYMIGPKTIDKNDSYGFEKKYNSEMVRDGVEEFNNVVTLYRLKQWFKKYNILNDSRSQFAAMDTFSLRITAYDDYMQLTNTDIDNVLKCVKIREEKGYGFIIIADNLKFGPKRLTSHYIFFDLSTRTMLWHEKIEIKPSGASDLEKIIFEGLLKSIKFYLDSYYKPEFNKYKLVYQ